MAIIKNALTYGFGFNVTAAGPVDSRMRVNYLTDLTTVWGTSTDGVFTPNPEAPVYAGMQVIVNEQNKAYILKQQVAEGYTLDDKTQVVKNGLVYNKADDAPIAANPTDINNWVPVGTDFSGDISSLDGRVDDLETFKTAVDKKLNISDNSALEFDANGALKVKIAENTENLINGLELDSNGALKVATYNLVAKTNTDDAYASQYEFKVNGETVTTINIPKDQFLKNAEFIASLSVEDATTYGLESGKPYLKFTWQLDVDPNTEGVQNVTFVPAKDLIDTYTGSDYIEVSNNTISVKVNALANALVNPLGINNIQSALASIDTTLHGGDLNGGLVADISNIQTELSGVKTNVSDLSTTLSTLGTNVSGLITSMNNVKVDLSNHKIYDVDSTVTNGIGLSLVTPEGGESATHVKVNVDLDTLAAAVIAKHDVPDPIASNIAVSAFGVTYTEDTNVQAVLESLDSRIKAAVSGGVTSVVAGVGINVNATDANNPTVSVKTSDLVVTGSALTVSDNKIDIIWSEL